MNTFKFAHGSHTSRWLLVAALCIAAAGCADPKTQAQQEQAEDGFILANNDGTMPEGIHASGSGALRISLPRDQSSFPSPGPDLGAVDTTVCNSCHSPTDIVEFTAPPGPRLELVEEQCRDCHSADYTSSQPTMTRAAWQKVAVKMADKFGAEEIIISPTENHPHQALILDYITAVYGKP